MEGNEEENNVEEGPITTDFAQLADYGEELSKAIKRMLDGRETDEENQKSDRGHETKSRKAHKNRNQKKNRKCVSCGGKVSPDDLEVMTGRCPRKECRKKEGKTQKCIRYHYRCMERDSVEDKVKVCVCGFSFEYDSFTYHYQQS